MTLDSRGERGGPAVYFTRIESFFTLLSFTAWERDILRGLNHEMFCSIKFIAIVKK